MSSINHSRVLILDYGSQYTQLIARRLRELDVYSHVLPGDVELQKISEFAPDAMILSGGPNSVYDAGAPTLPQGLMQYQQERKLPLLGVCYGMQLLVQHFGGRVEGSTTREYGKMKITPLPGSDFFSFHKSGAPFSVWMSHGDSAKDVPAIFKLAAKSESGGLAAIEAPAQKLYGVQFHPEVTHSEFGLEILKHFVFGIAGIKPDWTMKNFKEEEIARVSRLVPAGEHVICGLSGGVDSTVAAVLVHKAIGNRLHCIFVDHGMLRYQEQERVMKMFTEQLHLPVTCVDASERFLSKLAGVTDPEQKRKIIGAEFIAVFDEEAKRIGKTLGHIPEFLVQGTLYPDVIESSPAISAVALASKTSSTGSSIKKHSVTIKSHHNVGGLPADMRMKLIEPLRDLFKDEVRALGRELAVPEDFVKRHPFPGPGLAVRMIGEITRPQLEILKLADEVFIQEIRAAGLYDKIWQAMAVFLPIRTVGVQGDGRTHDYVIALRAVNSIDGMTADWYPFESAFLARVSSKICNEVRGVSRVVYDISSKPPATIEWE